VPIMLQRLDIVLNLKNSFDYAEFVSACDVAGVPPLSLGEFAQKTGMLKVAINMYPQDSPKDAYLHFIKTMNTEWVQRPTLLAEENNGVNPPKLSKGCGGCGGGKVR